MTSAGLGAGDLFEMKGPDMLGRIYVPDSFEAARRWMRDGLSSPAANLPRGAFVRAWCSLFYLAPQLHPDGFEDPGSGWPRRLRALAAEAWHRADAGEISEDQLYPSDAQWAGVCDRLLIRTVEEAERRATLAALYGDHPNA